VRFEGGGHCQLELDGEHVGRTKEERGICRRVDKICEQPAQVRVRGGSEVINNGHVELAVERDHVLCKHGQRRAVERQPGKRVIDAFLQQLP
jgi:hypothetical protein